MIGILLVNLGTPDAPDARSVRRYLAEFLSDRRVVELPPILWQPILRALVLNTRPKTSAEAYRQIWTEAGSPLAAITRAQADAINGSFGQNVMVDHAMRYGRPSIAERLGVLMEAGCDRILIAALYPQYSGATTASVNDAVFAAVGAMRRQPAIRTLPPWYDDPVYIDALKGSIETSMAALDFIPETVLASFHAMPMRAIEGGDPYQIQCVTTANLLSEALGRKLEVSFQSRLGRAKWMEPATDATLERLGREGVKSLAVVMPGFVADNLETLEEIAIRGRDSFLEAGGAQFAALPCLNASEAGVALLRSVIARELEGWTTPA